MLEFFLISFWASAMMAPLLSHPLAVALTLIVMALSLGTALGMSLSTWLSMAIILIFLSGMMVIFVYFASLVSNEKLTNPSTKFVSGIVALGVTFQCLINASTSPLATANFNFHSMNLFLMGLMMSYLLYSLFVVVELTYSFKGSLELSSF